MYAIHLIGWNKTNSPSKASETNKKTLNDP